jgi:hypothetical protein
MGVVALALEDISIVRVHQHGACTIRNGKQSMAG